MSNRPFFNVLGNTFSLHEVVGAIFDFVKEKPQRKYNIVIGTDSSARSEVNFVTAITIWRIGNGGTYFWTKSEKILCHDLRERIYKETIHSITLAQELRGRLKEKL